ncbi:hypothetical protein Rs2_34964 [Raphanus sativus]|nr:hypothetical protein Rs2_34964 [Raphanus sativus]
MISEAPAFVWKKLKPYTFNTVVESGVRFFEMRFPVKSGGQLTCWLQWRLPFGDDGGGSFSGGETISGPDGGFQKTPTVMLRLDTCPLVSRSLHVERCAVVGPLFFRC